MKKFGKLRQWTDEKLGGSHKTLATEEFRDMEAEINQRQQGLEAIHQASSVWMKALGKQKKSDGQDALKGTPIELLGIALYQHGEEFTTDSAYGQTLLQFGIAQQKIARLQDAFQEKVTGQILLNVERSLATMREYQAARKKLESRRLTYDSTLNKMQKAKKEDSKVEEELRAARVRYEELQSDVQQRMMSIRHGETGNMKDFADFIDAQAEYYHEASEVMVHLQEVLLRQVSGSISSSDGFNMHEPSSISRSRPQKKSAAAPISSPTKSRPVSSILSSANDLRDTSFGGQSFYSAREAPHTPALARDTSFTMSEERLGARSMRTLTPTAIDPPQTGCRLMKANFDFEAENPNELSIQRGNILQVLEENTAGWWTGQIIDGNGQARSDKGLFPANYCADYNIRQNRDAENTNVKSERQTLTRSTTDESLVRLSRQASASYSSSEKVRGTSRPPPPPIPKKKHGIVSASVCYSR